jgi:hypothetical protein
MLLKQTTLMGDIVPRASGFVAKANAFLSRPEVQATGIAVAFAAAATEILAPGGNAALAAAAKTLGWNIGGGFVVRQIERFFLLPQIFSDADMMSQHIGVGPDPEPSNKTAALQTCAGALRKKYFGAAAGITGVACLSSLVGPTMAGITLDPAQAFQSISCYFSAIARPLAGGMRWRGVEAGRRHLVSVSNP